jgi:hypothetical protein
MIKTITLTIKLIAGPIGISLVSQKHARFNKDNNCKSKHIYNKDVIKEAMAITITIVVISIPYIVKYPIYISWLFNKAINNPIYGPKWHKAIRTKLY